MAFAESDRLVCPCFLNSASSEETWPWLFCSLLCKGMACAAFQPNDLRHSLSPSHRWEPGHQN